MTPSAECKFFALTAAVFHLFSVKLKTPSAACTDIHDSSLAEHLSPLRKFSANDEGRPSQRHENLA